MPPRWRVGTGAHAAHGQGRAGGEAGDSLGPLPTRQGGRRRRKRRTTGLGADAGGLPGAGALGGGKSMAMRRGSVMMMADGSLAFCPGAPLGGGAGGGPAEGGGPGAEAGEAGAEEAKKGTTQEGLMRGLVRAPADPRRRPGGWRQ